MKFVNSLDVVVVVFFTAEEQWWKGSRAGPHNTYISIRQPEGVISPTQSWEEEKKEVYDGTGILSHYPNRKYFDSAMMHNYCRLFSRYGEVKFQLLFIQNDKFVSQPETQKGKPFCYCWLLQVVGHSSHFLPLFYDYFSILPKRNRKREERI